MEDLLLTVLLLLYNICTHVCTWISTHLKLMRYALLTGVQPPKSSDGMYKASNYVFIYAYLARSKKKATAL